MKKTALALLLGTALVVPAAFGQHGAPDVATMIQHRVVRLTTLLGLTSSQQAEATTIFTTAATNDKALEAAVRTARKQLHTDVLATQPDATPDSAKLTADATAVATAEAQLQAADAISEAQFLSILTASQQATLSALGEGFGGGHGPGGPGGFGGRP